MPDLPEREIVSLVEGPGIPARVVAMRRRAVFILGALLGTLLGACEAKIGPSEPASADAKPAPAAIPKPEEPANVTPAPQKEERLATFGGGCFWCTEAVYLRLKGVLGVESGYSGGKTQNPTYKQVGTGTTGHAEVIQIRYDLAVVSYETLLEVFFATHDPTTKDSQGADFGTQYRSIILTHDDAQRATAEAVKKRLDAAKEFPAPIVTEIVPFERFWKAEGYHQDFFAQNPDQGYCRAVVSPKVKKFEKAFKDKLKDH
jgi:peptide-methionine (S)-S-oxide reductase